MANKKTQVANEPATDSKYVNRKRKMYEEEVVPYLMKKFNYKNVNECPKLVKITLNTGLGDSKDNAKSVQTAAQVQARSAVVDRWNEYMKDVMQMDMDPVTGAQPLMRQVFLLE